MPNIAKGWIGEYSVDSNYDNGYVHLFSQPYPPINWGIILYAEFDFRMTNYMQLMYAVARFKLRISK